MDKTLADIYKRFKRLERDFIEYLNDNRESDEAKLVPIIEEHFYLLAYKKLKEERREDLAKTLFYGINEEFEKTGEGFERKFIHTPTGRNVEVDIADILIYGNEALWEDFGLEVDPRLKKLMEEAKDHD